MQQLRFRFALPSCTTVATATGYFIEGKISKVVDKNAALADQATAKKITNASALTPSSSPSPSAKRTYVDSLQLPSLAWLRRSITVGVHPMDLKKHYRALARAPTHYSVGLRGEPLSQLAIASALYLSEMLDFGASARCSCISSRTLSLHCAHGCCTAKCSTASAHMHSWTQRPCEARAMASAPTID